MRKPLAPVIIVVLMVVLLYEFNLQQDLMKENVVLSDRADDLQVSLEVCRNKEGGSNAFLLHADNGISIQTGNIDVSVKKIVERRKKRNIGFVGYKLVHLDFKGAPFKMSHLLEVLPFLKELGATGVLLEYEDMFPFKGKLELLKSSIAYSASEIEELLAKAKSLDLLVIPLVQTFGHLEFALKHDKFKHLRESPDYANAPCPSNKESQELAIEMINQVLELHPDIKYLHVGGDEVFGMKSCHECIASEKSTADLFNHHMMPILSHIKKKTSGDVRPIIWDDMLRKWKVNDIKPISELADIMIWGYVANLDHYPLFPSEMFEKFSSVFQTIWFASSFKGARGPNVNIPPIKMHVDNHLSWLKQIKSFKNTTKVAGVAITGWARYDHFATMCELFPAAIPSLAMCLHVLREGQLSKHASTRVGSLIGFKDGVAMEKDPFTSYNTDEGKFPGSEVYSIVAELENHISWYNDNKIRLDSWANARQIKKNGANLMHVEGVKSSLKMLIPSLLKFEEKCRIMLQKYYYEPSVTEWIADKISPYNQLADDLAMKVEKILSDANNHKNITSSKPTTEI